MADLRIEMGAVARTLPPTVRAGLYAALIELCESLRVIPRGSTAWHFLRGELRLDVLGWRAIYEVDPDRVRSASPA